MNAILAFLQTGLTPAILIGITLWNSDKALSDDGAKALYAMIEQTVNDPSHSAIAATINSFLDRYFSFQQSIFRFYLNVFWLTAVSLGIFLSIYAYKLPGIRDQLLTSSFISQFIGDGLFVTLLVNLFAFFTYNQLTKHFASTSLWKNTLLVILDLVVKILLFVVFTAFSYVIFASVNGAFGGSPMSALRSIPPTILFGAKFQDLTGVYIYSLVASSFPFFVAMLTKLIAAQPSAQKGIQTLMFWLPFKHRPLRAISTIFAVFCGLLVLLASAIIRPLQF